MGDALPAQAPTLGSDSCTFSPLRLLTASLLTIFSALLCAFAGAPDDLVNYFHFVAEEVRAGLAALGLRSLDQLIGRADLLRQVGADWGSGVV